MTSDKRLYLTRDDRVVAEGDEEAAFLLVGAGCELDDDTASKYGLISTPDAAVPTIPQPPAAEEDPEENPEGPADGGTDSAGEQPEEGGK